MMNGIWLPMSSSSNTSSNFCPLNASSNEASTTEPKAHVWANRLCGHFEQLNSVRTSATRMSTDDRFDRSFSVRTKSTVVAGSSLTESTSRSLTSPSSDRLNVFDTTGADGSGLLMPNQSSFNQPLFGYQYSISQPQTTTHQLGSYLPAWNGHNLHLSQVEPNLFYSQSVNVDSTIVVAHIVGKRGSKIRQLSNKHHVLINVPSPGTEPLFWLSGAPFNVLQAKLEMEQLSRHFVVHELMKQHKNDMMNHSDSNMFKVNVPAQYIRFIIGRNGDRIRNMQARFNIIMESPKPDQGIQYFKICGLDANVSTVLERTVTYLRAKTGTQFDRIYSMQTKEVHIFEVSPPGPTHSQCIDGTHS